MNISVQDKVNIQLIVMYSLLTSFICYAGNLPSRLIAIYQSTFADLDSRLLKNSVRSPNPFLPIEA